MSVDVYRVKVKKSKKNYQLLTPAIDQLQIMRDWMKTNIPKNEQSGNTKQAAFERENLTSYETAIDKLKTWQSATE